MVREALKRATTEFPDPDEATLAMVRTAVREGPVRSLVLLSGGVVPFAAVDTVLDVLNGEWTEAARRLRPRRPGRGSEPGAGSGRHN